MATSTTVKFQISVPSTDGNSAAAKVYNVTLSLQVESGCAEGGEIQVTLLPSESSTQSTGEGDGGFGVVPTGDVPPPQDPPKPN